MSNSHQNQQENSWVGERNSNIKTMQESFKKITNIVFSSRPIPSFFSTSLAFLSDIVVYISEIDAHKSRFRYNYPSIFETHEIMVDEGVRLSCMTAAHKPLKESPVLIVVPGLFNTKRQHVIIKIAKLAFFKWKYNVIVPDLRDFGETARICKAPLSATIKEGNDIVALARWAKSTWNVSKVFVTGFSYGGSVTLATSASSTNGEIDACIAFCPFTDIEAALDRLTSKTSISDPFWGFQFFFKCLLLKMLKSRGMNHLTTYKDYIAQIVAPFYGLSIEQFYYKASLINRVEDIRVPTLVIHSKDDPVVPYVHSLILKTAADIKLNSNLQMLIVEKGGHYANWLVSPSYTERVVRSFFEYWL